MVKLRQLGQANGRKIGVTQAFEIQFHPQNIVKTKFLLKVILMTAQVFFIKTVDFPLQQTRNTHKKCFQHIWLSSVFLNDTKRKVLCPFEEQITVLIQAKVFDQKLK